MEGERPHILYVEDDDINAFIITKMLKEFDVQVAKTCDDALQAFHPDISLIIMDINLGDARKDGVYCLQKLKEQCNVEVPVIALTAYAMPGDKERFLAAGFHSYLSKPIERHVLMDVIEQVVCKRHY